MKVVWLKLCSAPLQRDPVLSTASLQSFGNRNPFSLKHHKTLPASPPLNPAPMYQPSRPMAQQPIMGQSTSVQHTTVNINREMPQDFFIWSLMNFLYCNPLCVGLAALIHSVKSRDMKVAGDVEGARRYASTAWTLNRIATTVGLLGFIIFIVLFTRRY
uniref:Uncharacterized protein n=1 Tax=Neogobius melanostomus TaxID=47308 RepID=A0A8C6SHR2_9GOBI